MLKNSQKSAMQIRPKYTALLVLAVRFWPKKSSLLIISLQNVDKGKLLSSRMFYKLKCKNKTILHLRKMSFFREF